VSTGAYSTDYSGDFGGGYTTGPIAAVPPWHDDTSLVTAAQITASLGITDATQAQAVADQVSGMVRSWCGWTISQQRDRVEVFDDDGSAKLYLPTLCLLNVTDIQMLRSANGSVTMSPVAAFSWSKYGTVVVQSTGAQASSAPWTYGPWAYGTWSEWGLLRWGGQHKPNIRRGWQITYDHGYSPVPNEVQAATLTLAQRIWENPTGATQVRLGDFMAQYKAASMGGGGVDDLLDPVQRAILGRYRLPVKQ
jgi:hypothetical protein